MVELSGPKTTLSEIERVGQSPIKLRPYLGMSQIGHSCERYLWYSFHWAYGGIVSARMNRLYSRGDREEPAIYKILEDIGLIVWGTQTEFIEVYGHCKGHCDGVARGVIEAPKTNHVLEIKTMADKYFKDIQKNGLKLSKPVYYSQMQIYMKCLNLNRGLFIAVNKNDDDLYIERVYYDKEHAQMLLKKATDIIISNKPPTKKFKPTWYECGYCDARGICHQNVPVQINCRTCEFVNILNDGKWGCNDYKINLSTSQQRLGCDKYEILNTLIK
jgi:hypothetical protein